MKKPTSYPPITRDLAQLPGEVGIQRLMRIASQATLPGHAPRLTPPEQVAGTTFTPEEIAELESVAAKRSEEALSKLQPKKRRIK